MDSRHFFDEGLMDWISSVNRAIEKELKENPGEYRELFNKINSALTLFSPIAEYLPTENSKWIFDEDKIPTPSSNIQIIMEFMTQAIYMQASHLWPAANHSARCALEHTFLMIWQISNPRESKTGIGGPGKAKFSDMAKAVFDIPRFTKCKNKFDFPGDGGQTKALPDKINEVYGHLSYYVHTSNIHIELKGARPHITHDLGNNPKAKRDTRKNISETFSLIIILLAITCKDSLGEDGIRKIEEITSPEIRKDLSEVI